MVIPRTIWSVSSCNFFIYNFIVMLVFNVYLDAMIITFMWCDDVGMLGIFYCVDIAFFHTSWNTKEKVIKKRIIGTWAPCIFVYVSTTVSSVHFTCGIVFILLLGGYEWMHVISQTACVTMCSNSVVWFSIYYIWHVIIEQVITSMKCFSTRSLDD